MKTGRLSAYPPPPAVPTHTIRSIRYDFNLGCRVSLPEGEWRVVMRDLDTGNVLYDETVTGPGMVNSAKRFFVRYRIEVMAAGRLVLEHDYHARWQRVLVLM